MALTEIKTSGIADDAVTTDKLANAINTERTANTAKTSTTINNNADNRVITGSGTANTLEGEANLTFDGDDLLLKSSTDGRRISFAGDGTSHYMKYDNTLGGIILNGYGGITFETNGTNERVRIDSAGDLLIGHSSSVTASGNDNRVQIHGGNFADSTLFIGRYANGSSGACLSLGMSRNGTVGSQTIVQDGDEVGKIRFYGSDGNNFDNFCAEIRAQIDGTPGSDDMPGRLVFQTTADGATSPTERMRIASSGNVGIGTTSPASLFHLKATAPIQQLEASSYSSYIGTAQANDNIGNGTKAGNLVLRGQTGVSISGNGGTATQVKIDADGLKFGTDTAAANALDDYEEGTWTMTAQSGADSIGQNAANQRYTKIGNVVTVVGEVTGLTNATGSTLNIAGLPYNVAWGREGAGSCFSNNVTFPSGYSGPTMYSWADTDRLRVYVSTSGGGWHPLTGTQVGSGSFIFTVSYLTS